MTQNKLLFRPHKRNRSRRAARREDPTIVFKNFVRALERLRPAAASPHKPVAAAREKA
jgi:hypothetical protein